MAEIINLRMARKRKQRDEKATQAAENRVLFGRTKGERQADALEKDHAERVLDGAFRQRTDEPNDAQ